MSEIKYDEIPTFKEGQNIDLQICHWTNFAPNKSGLYETVKELIKYENRIDGVLAGMVDPAKREGGQQDPDGLTTQSVDWGVKDCNLHMIHYTETKDTINLSPRIFMTHGTVEACLESEMTPQGEVGQSFSSCMQRIANCEATISFNKRAKYYWSQFDPTNEKVHCVTKGIDLEKYKPMGTRRNFDGTPKIGYAETWRAIKHPLHLLFGINEYFKRNPYMKFHPVGASQNWRLWHKIILLANFHRLLGKYEMSMSVVDIDQWYRGFDMMVSPVLTGEPSRAGLEALACGCPVISWDTNPFDDMKAFRKAKFCDPVDLANQIESLWDEIQKDPLGIRVKARRIAEENYSMKKMAEEVVGIARKVVNER